MVCCLSLALSFDNEHLLKPFLRHHTNTHTDKHKSMHTFSGRACSLFLIFINSLKTNLIRFFSTIILFSVECAALLSTDGIFCSLHAGAQALVCASSKIFRFWFICAIQFEIFIFTCFILWSIKIYDIYSNISVLLLRKKGERKKK